MPNTLSCGIILVCAVLLVGCSRPESPESPAPAPTASDSQMPEAAARAGERAAAASTSLPADDPALALTKLAEGFAAGDANRMNAALPDAARQRMDAWWNDSVLAVDPGIRRDVAAAVAQFAETLLAQRAFVLATDRIEIEGAAAGIVRRRFDAVLHAVIELAAWPGWSSTEERGGIGPLLDRLSRVIAAEPDLQEEVRGLSFQTVSRDGESGIVRMTTADRSSRVDLAVSQQGDHWVPTAFVETSPSDGTADPAARGATMQTFAAVLHDVNGVLKTVASQAEFDAQVDRAAELLMASAGRALAAPRAVGQEELVTVHVLGAFDANEKDRLLWEVVSQTDAPASGQAESIDRTAGDGVSMTVGPVADVAAFADRLTGLTVESVDADGRTITARRREP